MLLPGGYSWDQGRRSKLCLRIHVYRASAIISAKRGVMTESSSTTNTNQPAIQRRSRLTGFPGENQGVLAVLHYIDTGTKAHLNAHGPAGLPGMYTVEFVLAKPDARNAPENEFRFADQRRGDSHLAIAKPAVIIDIDPTEVLLHFQSPSSPALVFHGFPNDAGYLAKLKSAPFHASNRGEAEKSRRPPCEACSVVCQRSSTSL